MMPLEAILGDDVARRRAALEGFAQLADHERFTLASEVAAIAKKKADDLAEADETGRSTTVLATELGRAAVALAMLRGEVAKNCLVRMAEERSYAVKAALARSLRETQTEEGRAVLVYLLSDDDAQADALVAIGAAPWPEILPALIEIAEADDRTARLAARPIARCGASAGPNEMNAAASFLLEQLDDDSVVFAAADAIVRYGASFTGVLEKGRRLAAAKGNQRVAGMVIVAATGTSLDEFRAPKRAEIEERALGFLRSLRDDPDPRLRDAATLTYVALAL